MNVVQTSIFFLPLTDSVGGSVYVPPAVCPRSVYITAHAAAHVERTGSARTSLSADRRSVSGLTPNSLILEVS
jgi:hypothetical protein